MTNPFDAFFALTQEEEEKIQDRCDRITALRESLTDYMSRETLNNFEDSDMREVARELRDLVGPTDAYGNLLPLL